MINLIGTAFTTQLATIVWADEVNGIVTKLSEVINTEGGGAIEKTYPAVYVESGANCNVPGSRACIPDSSKRSVIYIEDRGTLVSRLERNVRYFEAEIRVVCWLNYKLINPALTESDRMVYDVIDTIPDSFGNYGFLNTVRVELRGIPTREEILSNYTYPYIDGQITTFPYDIFAVDFRVTYSLGRNCLDPIEILPSC